MKRFEESKVRLRFYSSNQGKVDFIEKRISLSQAINIKTANNEMVLSYVLLDENIKRIELFLQKNGNESLVFKKTFYHNTDKKLSFVN